MRRILNALMALSLLGICAVFMPVVSAADTDLIAIKADHLFRPSMTQIAFKNSAFLRNYMYDFITYFSPHLTKECGVFFLYFSVVLCRKLGDVKSS